MQMQSIKEKHSLKGAITSSAVLSGTLGNEAGINGDLSNSLYRGLSAYEIAVKNGFIGTEDEWINSLAVRIEEVSNTDDEYVIKFITHSNEIYTPNLIPHLSTISSLDIDNIIKEVYQNE